MAYRTDTYDDATHKIVSLQELKTLLSSISGLAYLGNEEEIVLIQKLVAAAAEPQQPAQGVDAEALAQRFHEIYERLAPSFGYETRKDSAKPWSEVHEQNKSLMIAVCGEIAADGYLSKPAPLDAERAAALEAMPHTETWQDPDVADWFETHELAIRTALTNPDPRHDREQKLVEAVKKVVYEGVQETQGDYPSAKNNKCKHDNFGFEGCEQCTDEFLAAALAEYEASKGK